MRRNVYLVWDPLVTLFKVSTEDFDANLARFFVPGVHDLVVIDEQLRWVLFLQHFGEVHLTRMRDGPR